MRVRDVCALLAGVDAMLRPAASHGAATSATVGDPKNPGALAQAVQEAYAGGAQRIVIRPGVYVLPQTDHASFVLDGWKDAVISAYRVTLISSENKWNRDLFDIRHCANVTLEGPTLSQTGLTAYQGQVIAVGVDVGGKAYVDWRPDTGYPVPPLGAAEFPGAANVVDGKTRRLKIGVGDYYDAPMETVDPRTFRVHFKEAKLNFSVGDWLVGRYGDAPFKVFLDGSCECTIRDVTLMRNGFAPLREDGGGANRLLRVHWALGPRPAGATEESLVTNAADGFHSTGANPGPDIEGCTFTGVFLDDCIAIHGGFQKIVSTTGNTITLEKGRGSLRVGEPARISSDKGFFAESLVTAVVDNPDKTATVTFEHALDVPAGAKVGNPRADGAGYIISGCHLGDTRSRGILVKSDRGMIKNNVIDGCGMSAVSIGPEYYWGEADYAWNVIVADNILRGNGQAGYGGGCVLIHGDGAIGNRDIVVRGNRFESNYQGDIDAQWTEGLTISGNRIVGATTWPPTIRNQSPIAVANCRRVAFRGNSVGNAAVYKPEIVAVGANVTDIRGNDAGGVTVAGPGQPPDKPARGRAPVGSPNDPLIRYVGRWDRTDPAVSRGY